MRYKGQERGIAGLNNRQLAWCESLQQGDQPQPVSYSHTRDGQRRTSAFAVMVALVLLGVLGVMCLAGCSSGASASASGSVANSEGSSGVVVDNENGTVYFGAATSSGGSGITTRGVSETPTNYGTSPASIANGGYVAYANGRTYYVGDPNSSESGSAQMKRTAIASCEDKFANGQVLYQAEKIKTSETGYREKSISCLHVTGDSLVFCESYSNTGNDMQYDIVKTNLDGTGRKALVEGVNAKDCSLSAQTLGSYMWLDDGNIYFLEKESLWSQPLSGGSKEHVVEVKKTETCSVDDGVVYYSIDDGYEVTALDIASGKTETVYRGDWNEGVEATDDELMRTISGAPYVRTIQPDGNRIVYGVTTNQFMHYGDPLEGFISIKRDGTDGEYYSGMYDEKDGTGAIACYAHEGDIYMVYGAMANGMGIVKFDPSAKDDKRFSILYGSDGKDKSSDGAVESWLTVSNDRVYFGSHGAANITGIGESKTEQQQYDRGTPWSVKLDGTDLHKGMH